MSTSNSWFGDYLSALEARDTQEQALKHAYDAYSKLADRYAVQAASPQPTELPPGPTHTPPPPVTGRPRTSPRPSTPDTLTSLRADLTAAQSSKNTLTTRLATLTTAHDAAQKTLTNTTARLTSLESSHAVLARKLRDREDELKAKKQLLERVQDELLAAEMEMNVALDERRRVEEENRELVGRLVGEKEAEVEKMNRMGGWS